MNVLRCVKITAQPIIMVIPQQDNVKQPAEALYSILLILQLGDVN